MGYARVAAPPSPVSLIPCSVARLRSTRDGPDDTPNVCGSSSQASPTSADVSVSLENPHAIGVDLGHLYRRVGGTSPSALRLPVEQDQVPRVPKRSGTWVLDADYSFMSRGPGELLTFGIPDHLFGLRRREPAPIEAQTVEHQVVKRVQEFAGNNQVEFEHLNSQEVLKVEKLRMSSQEFGDRRRR